MPRWLFWLLITGSAGLTGASVAILALGLHVGRSMHLAFEQFMTEVCRSPREP